MIKSSIMELVDTALDPERVNEIQGFIAQIDGVRNVHMLRTRKMGGNFLADVHVQVDSHISVSEGHHIAERVMHDLDDKFSDLNDITVHIDPEDDETSSPSSHLPSRKELLDKIFPLLHELGVPNRGAITLHFLDGEISVLIYLKDVLSVEKITQVKKICLAEKGIVACSVYTEHVEQV